MKILYAIQKGTGNGHVSRAENYSHPQKIWRTRYSFISGTQADVNLDEEIKYQFKGFGLISEPKGGIDL